VTDTAVDVLGEEVDDEMIELDEMVDEVRIDVEEVEVERIDIEEVVEEVAEEDVERITDVGVVVEV
jgi:hypothetical protein